MANTIANFLVGVGLDTKDFDKGAKGVDSSLSGFRSKARLAGGAIVAAFGAAGVMAIKAGNDADAFMRKVAKFSTAPRFIYNLGQAFDKMGGQAEDAISTISKTEGILDALRKGDASALEAAGLAQVDVSQLQNSQTGEELLGNLADVLSRTADDRRGESQRRSLAETFGLSNEGLDLLRQGRGAMYQAVEDVDRYAENLEAAARAGREYAEAMFKVNGEFKRIGNTLAKEVLPKFSALLDSFSNFLSANKPRIDAAANYIAENAGSVSAVGGGLAVAGAAKAGAAIASKLGMTGLSSIGRGVAVGGTVGAAAGAGSLLWDLRASDIKDITGHDVGKYYRAPSETWENAKDWWRGGAASNSDAAASSPSALAARKPSLSEMARSDASVPPPIVVESKLYLNEREIAKTVRKVNAEDNYNAYTEVLTTESR